MCSVNELRSSSLIVCLAGDKDIGHLLPIPTDTMQLFDEVKGEVWHGFPAVQQSDTDIQTV
jgi:hypothetical protein